MDRYKIVDDFQVKSVRVLVIDRNYEYGHKKLTIDNKEYRYILNSMPNWVIVQSTDNFKGKTAIFE